MLNGPFEDELVVYEHSCYQLSDTIWFLARSCGRVVFVEGEKGFLGDYGFETEAVRTIRKPECG